MNPPTPYLKINAQRVRRNIEKLAAYAAQHNLGIRPHTKTHKSRRVAQMQLEAGAVGLTCAKVGEVETISGPGEDVLLAYPAVDPARCQRLAKLAGDRTIRVAIDSVVAAQALAQAAQQAGTVIGILVDLDVGMGRTGLQSPRDTLELAREVDRLRGLRVDGLFCYPGFIWQPADQQAEAFKPVIDKLEETVQLWRQAGLNAGIVSSGSTPTAYQSHLVPQVTEIRPGTYVYQDMNGVHGGFCSLEECAATIVCTVVSNAVPGQVVIDAGSKTLTSDRCLPAPDSGHGYVLEYPQARITRLTEEHGQVDIRQCDRAPKIGERVTVIPNHICPCVNLHEAAWWEEDGRLQPLRIDARGKLS
ncbi:MAG TPA: alanine racemase [Phycisphaeraceae bacterium]